MNSFAACTYVRAMCLLTETNLDVYAHCLEQYEISVAQRTPQTQYVRYRRCRRHTTKQNPKEKKMTDE